MKHLVSFLIFLVIITAAFVFWFSGASKYFLTKPIPSPEVTQTETTNRTSPIPSSTICSAFTVVSPQPGTRAISPLSVNVIVDNTHPDCHWTVFEAQAGMAQVIDSSGNVLGQTSLKTLDDWTLSKPTPYNGTISFTQKPSPGNLSLIIREENPSGKPEAKIITVTLSQ